MVSMAQQAPQNPFYMWEPTLKCFLPLFDSLESGHDVCHRRTLKLCVISNHYCDIEHSQNMSVILNNQSCIGAVNICHLDDGIVSVSVLIRGISALAAYCGCGAGGDTKTENSVRAWPEEQRARS